MIDHLCEGAARLQPHTSSTCQSRSYLWWCARHAHYHCWLLVIVRCLSYGLYINGKCVIPYANSSILHTVICGLKMESDFRGYSGKYFQTYPHQLSLRELFVLFALCNDMLTRKHGISMPDSIATACTYLLADCAVQRPISRTIFLHGHAFKQWMTPKEKV